MRPARARINCSWRRRMRRSSLGVRKPDWRKSCARMSPGLRVSRVPVEVSTEISSSGEPVGGVGGSVGYMRLLLDGEFGEINFFNRAIAEDGVEAGDQFVADHVARAGFFQIGEGLGGQCALGHVAELG